MYKVKVDFCFQRKNIPENYNVGLLLLTIFDINIGDRYPPESVVQSQCL
jgi:hypothetical protein